MNRYLGLSQVFCAVFSLFFFFFTFYSFFFFFLLFDLIRTNPVSSKRKRKAFKECGDSLKSVWFEDKYLVYLGMKPSPFLIECDASKNCLYDAESGPLKNFFHVVFDPFLP